MDKIYDYFLKNYVSRENYFNELHQIVTKSYRSSRWTEYQIQKFANTLMRVDGYDDQIVIESERDFCLLLQALLDKREQITNYPSLIFNTLQQNIQKFRIFQFLDVSVIQIADLSKEILEIQQELNSLKSLNVSDLSLIQELKQPVLSNLQQLTLTLKYLSKDNVIQLNSILQNSNLRQFSVRSDFIEESEDIDEDNLKKSTKFVISKKFLSQLSFSSNCFEYFIQNDLLDCQNLQIFIHNYEFIDKIKQLNLKNINKLQFNIEIFSNFNPTSEIQSIIIQNQMKIVELSLSLIQLLQIAQDLIAEEFSNLESLNIFGNQYNFDEQNLFPFLSNQKNLKNINIEMAQQNINQNLMKVIFHLYLLKKQNLYCKCYQSHLNVQNQQHKNLFHFTPSSIEFINELQGYHYESILQLQNIFQSMREANNLIKINLNLNSRIYTLSAEDQENIIKFVCINKLAESVKINFSFQTQNKKIYQILADNIDQLTNLREGSFGFNFNQEFDSYAEFKRIMDKCILLQNLVSLCWILNGHGEYFEIFAIECLIDYHKITDLQIENHVKGAYCIEIFMDYIKKQEVQYQLWQKIGSAQIESINYFFMKKVLPKHICLEIAYLLTQNEYIQTFTTSLYDVKVKEEETIDYYFYILLSYRVSMTLFYKDLYSIMQTNPLFVIYDLHI